jgi:hypothetical protein
MMLKTSSKSGLRVKGSLVHLRAAQKQQLVVGESLEKTHQRLCSLKSRTFSTLRLWVKSRPHISLLWMEITLVIGDIRRLSVKKGYTLR